MSKLFSKMVHFQELIFNCTNHFDVSVFIRFRYRFFVSSTGWPDTREKASSPYGIYIAIKLSKVGPGNSGRGVIWDTSGWSAFL